MITFLVRRLLQAILLLLIVSFVTFWIFFVVPRWGGQSSASLASQFVGRNATPATIQQVVHHLGLDQNVFVQYYRYIKAIVAGTDYNTGTQLTHCAAPCLGFSYVNTVQVLPQIMNRFPVTFSLVIGAAVLWLIFGVAIGVLSAIRRGSFVDRASMIIALGGVSLPIFFTAPVSMFFFVYQWNWLPHPAYNSFLSNPGTWARGLILPWVTLAFLYAALYARLTRAGMLDTMNEDFIRTARAKGLPERKVVLKHGLRAALTPIVTIFGMDFGLLLGSAVLTETAYSLPGINKYAIDAITTSDFPVIMGVTLFAAAFIVVANLIVDMVYAAIDPRVRLA